MEPMMSEHPLVQWSFLQYKKFQKNGVAPKQSFLHSATQIGSKILIYGGCDYNGEGLNQLLLYDTVNYQWSSPADGKEFQEDHPGGRYGHSAVLVEMHPPKVMVYGGMVDGGTFEFDAPDSAQDAESSTGASAMERTFMSWRKSKKTRVEETDDAVYFLTLNADKWIWSKPLVHGGRVVKPPARAEHSACKTDTNEVTIFGGWTSNTGPSNDMWTFDFINMEWRPTVSSGIQPRPRYRHTAEMVGSKMYVLGGSDNGDDVAIDCKHLSIHELSMETMQWSHPTIRGADPFPRSGHGSAVIGAMSVAIFGGKRSNQEFLNDLILIDLEKFVATRVNAVEKFLPMEIANSSLSAIGNKCFVYGGTDAKGACYNDIRSLDVGHYLSSDDITVGEGASSDYSFKILIIGDAGVGKSALLTRFSENTFLHNYTSTIGIDFNSRMIRVDKAICKLEMWDTAGQERFSTITANYYRGSQGALLVYDVSSRESFEHVKKWYDRAKQLGGEDLICVLVGNKSDLDNGSAGDLLDTSSAGGRIADDTDFLDAEGGIVGGGDGMDGAGSAKLPSVVSAQEGEELAASLGIQFVHTSALTGLNVESAFVTMTLGIKKSVDARGLTGIKDANLQKAGGVTIATHEKKSGCC